MNHNQTPRRTHRAVLALEMIEDRILLSHGAIPSPRTANAVLIEAARRQRLSISGNLTGGFSYQTTNGINYFSIVTGQGGSRNRKVGQLALQTQFTTTLRLVTDV